MILFAVSDVVWQALIAAVLTIVMAWMNQRTKAAVEKVGRDAEAKADAVAVKAEEVKDSLAKSTALTSGKLDAIAVTGDKVHTLVNNRMGIALTALAESLRWKATSTKLQSDIDAADKAEAELRDHNEKQATVDAKEK